MIRRAWFCLLICGLALPACAGSEPSGTIEFVESWPQHTELDLADLRDASEVWPLVLGGAKHNIELAGFYFSRKGDGNDSYGPESAPDLFLPVLDALRTSADRGVKIRTLADAKFNKTYPDVPLLLGELPGAETRILDLQKSLGGGVLHAKYFLADEDVFYVGSQNFDWRALGQIHELGVLVKHKGLAADARRIFDLDWTLAGGERWGNAEMPSRKLAELPKHPVRLSDGTVVEALITASPLKALPHEIPWDLPLLIEMIDAAQDSVHLQLLSYGVTDREKRVFDDLDRALKRAAVRGAKVRIILANWSKRNYSLPWIKGLALLKNIEVRFTNIPEHPDGFIPFARVEHAKYLTVDGKLCWIGTSNWSRDYFHASRNVGVILVGEGSTTDPDRFFNLSWNSPYAEIVEPGAEYTAPKRD